MAMQTEGNHKTGGLALAPGHECCYRVVQVHVLQVTCCRDVLHVYATTVLRFDYVAENGQQGLARPSSCKPDTYSF
jgi:hypothetical protein